MINYKLHELDKPLKNFISVFIIVLTVGVLIGLVYVSTNTQSTASGLSEHYRGTEVVDDLDVPEKYPKAFSAMLLNTHSHILSFAVIFLAIGAIFYFNTTINGSMKSFLMIEPLIATLVTFGSLWGLRYVSPHFSYVVVISGILMYSSYFIMVGVILYETLFKKN